jgi:2-oxoglutarate ferredoxin oxidoreductase subunit beta
VDYEPGTTEAVELHDGSVILLAKLHKDYDPHDRVAAMNYMHSRAAAGELVTGLIYLDPNPGDLHASLNTVDQPLNALGAQELCPGSAALEKINASLR